jgi:DNA helicase IV
VSQPHPELESEQQYIDYAYDCLEQELVDAAEHPLAEAGADKHAARQLRKVEAERLAALADAGREICFGRIDPATEQALYIGRERIRDGAKTVVISWQVPKAAPFYMATPSDPHGLAGRRRFTMDGRRLTGIDEDLFEEVPPAVPAPVAPSDPLLAELERHRSAEMRDVVATIQADQYEIISSALAGVQVVQGGPGTGKTAVGLHRASWLLFNYREDLERPGVLVIGPNRAFMEYIRRVLPSLGETAVDQTSIDFLAGIRPKHHDLPDVQRLKGDVRMAEVIAREASRRVRSSEESFEFRFQRREYRVSGDAVQELAGSVLKQSLPYMEGRRRFRDALVGRAIETIALGSSLSLTAEETEGLVRQLRSSREFQNAAERAWPTLSSRQLVQELLTGPQRLAVSADGILSETEQTILRRQETPLEQTPWTRSDVALIHEAEFIVQGQRDRYGHVIVDEAQDLTPMEILMAGRRATGGSMTLLGDLAQATGPHEWRSWDEITDHLPTGVETRLSTLPVGYRVPKRVLALAAQILLELPAEVAPPESIRDPEEDPSVVQTTIAALPERVVAAAAAYAELGGTVGVIAPQDLHAGLIEIAKRVGLSMVDVSEGALGESVSLLEPREAKGLEFDHVVVAEPAAIAREPIAGLALLYVALTRPTRGLSVVHSEPLPAAMRDDEAVPSEPVEVQTPLSQRVPVGLVEAISLGRALLADHDTSNAALADGFERISQVIRDGGDEYAAVEAFLDAVAVGTDDEGIKSLLKGLRR